MELRAVYTNLGLMLNAKKDSQRSGRIERPTQTVYRVCSTDLSGRNIPRMSPTTAIMLGA